MKLKQFCVYLMSSYWLTGKLPDERPVVVQPLKNLFWFPACCSWPVSDVSLEQLMPDERWLQNKIINKKVRGPTCACYIETIIPYAVWNIFCTDLSLHRLSGSLLIPVKKKVKKEIRKPPKISTEIMCNKCDIKEERNYLGTKVSKWTNTRAV